VSAPSVTPQPVTPGAPPPADRAELEARAMAGLPPASAPVLPLATGNVVEPLLSELSVPGHRGVRLPAPDVPTLPLASLLPAWAVRAVPAALPEVSEPEVIRHFTRLSTLNTTSTRASTRSGRAP